MHEKPPLQHARSTDILLVIDEERCAQDSELLNGHIINPLQITDIYSKITVYKAIKAETWCQHHTNCKSRT